MDSAKVSEYLGVGNEAFLSKAAMTSLVGAFTLVYFLCNASRVEDKLMIEYKKDSKLMNKILKNTNLRKLSYRPCIAGTFQKVHMCMMIMIEQVYLKFCT
jgi:hypothetical protein